MNTSALLEGFAELIAAEGIGVMNPTGIYTPDQIGITVRSVPQAPDQLIVLSSYRVSDSMLNDSIVGMQIRCRGDADPRTVLDRDDAIFNVLEGLHDTAVGGVPVQLVWRQSGLDGPQDANQRWEQSSNYYVRLTWPTRYRTD